MLKVFKNEKLWCAVAGAAAVIVGKKILKADKTRSLAVTGLAKGMKLRISAMMLKQRQVFTKMLPLKK